MIFDAARAANTRLEAVEKSASWLSLTPDEFEKRAHIGSVITGAWGVRRASILMTAGLRASDLTERDECLRWVGRERKEFDRCLPGLIHLRNIYEHFDDYARGEGRLQARGVDCTLTYDFSPGREIARAGPWTLEVRIARAAAHRLAANLGGVATRARWRLDVEVRQKELIAG